MMVHRRTVHDDSRGVSEPINETESIEPYPSAQRIGRGINVTGMNTHTYICIYMDIIYRNISICICVYDICQKQSVANRSAPLFNLRRLSLVI